MLEASLTDPFTEPLTKASVTKSSLFQGLNLKSILSNPNFKEDSVREFILQPILKALGYTVKTMVLSKTLKHPYLKVGSKKRPINLIPDYSLKVKERFAWVLDAKSPQEKINDQDNVEQVYSYASHIEIRSTFFALSNGLEFSVYRREAINRPILQFAIDEIEYHWEKLKSFLAPSSFQFGKSIAYETMEGYSPGYSSSHSSREKFIYANRPLLEEIPVRKQAAKRHFGVHGYFTRQTWNVVAEYIKNFTKPGDLVLDPYGGSGITAVEALMNQRKAINIDINPLAVFMVRSLMAPVSLPALSLAFEKIKASYSKKEPKTEAEVREALKKYPRPKVIPLPQGSDVETTDQLFSDKQKAQLGLLKSLILKIKDKNIRDSFLLMFSGLVTKVNLTYHPSKTRGSGGGDAAAFRYYRYRITPKPTAIGTMKYFELRYQKVLAAKKEMEYHINAKTISGAQVLKGTATDLSFIKKESVDYIYTDPPYGKKIPYLDLSAMWNAWLDLEVSQEDYALEAIEGGELGKSKDAYNELIAKSIQEMYRVLKFDRWLSFVFAHKDPEFWHLIIETAEACGFEYIGAVPQKNGQTSFKKRQNPFTVLSGQLIINFRKVKKPKAMLKANLGMDIAEVVLETIEGIIAKNEGATLEEINDELIIKGLELGFLDLLKKEYKDLSPLLLENFAYDESLEKYFIKKETKFKTKVDLKLRIRYYLLSYLVRMEKENKDPTFDDIIHHITPLLKNGITPENQTIESVLKKIAKKIKGGKWRLNTKAQQELFH